MDDPLTNGSGAIPGDASRGALRDLAILAAISIPAFFVGLGRPSIQSTQEVRVLETAREMQESGDLLVPRFCGEPRFQKPPLAYWLALAGYEAAGAPSEAAGRFYSAAAGMLTVLLLYGFGRSAGRPRLGLWAGTVLATSLLYFRFARNAETDVLLGCAVAASLISFWRAFQGPGAPGGGQRLWRVLAWASAAVGFLAKGPAGLTYVLLPILLYLGCARRWRDLARAFDPLGLAVFALLAAPWFVAVALREDLAVSVFWKEIAVVTGGGTHGKENLLYKIFYYPIYLLRDFEPWCIFLIPALPAACRRLREEKFLGFALAWAGGILLQLELIGNKQPHYIIPAFPALALIAAWWLESPAPPLRPFPAVWSRRIFLALSAAMLIAAPLHSYLGEQLVRSGKGCREFSRAARAAIGNSDVYFLGQAVPAANFYLDRVVPVVKGEDLGDLKGGFFVIALKEREKDKVPEAPDLSKDPRFRRVLEAPPGEIPLELYRAGS